MEEVVEASAVYAEMGDPEADFWVLYVTGPFDGISTSVLYVSVDAATRELLRSIDCTYAQFTHGEDGDDDNPILEAVLDGLNEHFVRAMTPREAAAARIRPNFTVVVDFAFLE